LIRTPCDLFPLETLPLPAAALPDDTPLLLPLNRCQPPALDCEVDPADVEPAVEPSEPRVGRRLTADVLPEDDEVGFTRCHPLLLLEELPVAPALCAAGLAAGCVVAALAVPLAERVIACRC
jgi:hypothetical protein